MNRRMNFLSRRNVNRTATSFVVFSMLMMASILVILPEGVNAETKPGGTLKNDRGARIYTSGWWWTSVPDELQFKIPTSTNDYTAVAIVNRATGEDFDLFLYDDYEMSQKIGSSTLGSDKVDFVVIDGHTYTGNIKYGNVIKFTGQDWSSGITIESDYHTVAADLYGSDPDADGDLEIGERRYSMFEYHGTGTYSGTLRGDYPLVNMYDVYLDAGGSYDFDLYSVPSGQQLSMYLFKGSGNGNDALVSDHADSSGDSLSFSYDPELSGNYGICVIDENSGYSSSDNYTLVVTSDFELDSTPVSNLIAPGMNASYKIDVRSLGITKDIDLHYRWQSTSGNVSSPSGASASLSKDTVNTGGAKIESVYLNVTTTSSVSAGTYYLVLYGNDTGYNGASKGIKVTLRVSTNPDFFLTAEQTIRSVSPGTDAKYEISMDTINSYSGNVSMTATTISGGSYFNTSFSPNPITSGVTSTNLTILTSSGTPVGIYNFTVSGSDGTLTRYANVSLRIKEPITIDVISPIENELVAGVYDFKVSAGRPAESKSVKISFGGTMVNAGTLNMYFNSAANRWERSVNTYTYRDGACWLNITVEDYGGGITTFGPLNFTVSNSAPNPIINTPLDRSYVTGTSMPISVNTTSYVISARFKIDENAWIPLTRSGNTWTGSWDTTKITDGTHTLTIDAKDTAGMTGESTVTIFVDNTNPTCGINSPIDGQFIENSYTFRVVATDTVGVNHVDINIFGQNVTLPYNPITSSYEYTVSTQTKPDGTYKTYATAYDNVNQSKRSDIITFHIDNNAPSLTIDQPVADSIIGGIYNVSITSSDQFLDFVQYRVDSSGWKNLSGTEPNWWVHLDTTALSDGDHLLTVRSQDRASHLTEQSVDFVVDNTNPTSNIVSPFNNEFVAGVYTFKVSSTDIVGVDRVMLEVFSDTVQATFNRQNGFYEYAFNTLIMSDGTYDVMAISYDLSGKWMNSSVVSFRVDNNAPEMSINDVQTGDYVNGVIMFNLSVNDAFLDDVRYSVDGGGWVNISNPWDTTKLLDGKHTVSFRARDLAGHTTTQSIDLVVDNHLPVTAVNSPVPDEFIQGAYKFRLSATDQVGIERVELHVFNNNFTAIFSMTSGYFEFNSDTSIQKDGNYSCYAIAYDKSGKINTSEIIEFQVDNNAPVMRVLHPLDGSFMEGIETVDVNVSDVFLDRVEYNVDSSGWIPIDESFNTSLFSDGEHRMDFRAIDLAGHTTTSSHTVIIDNTLPYAAISDPVSNQYIDGTALFKVIASDLVGIKEVKIEIFNSTLDMNYNSGSGYYEYRTDTRLIPDGTYLLNVTVSDLSGKQVTLGPLMFNLDNHDPELTVSGLTNGDILEGIFTIDAIASDIFLDKVQYQVDETQWVDISTPLNTSMFEDGSHTMRVRAVDLSGKRSMVSFDLIIDNLAPVCTITSPVTDEFVEGIITIKVTAFDQVKIDYVMIKVYNIEVRVPYNAQTGYYEYASNTITWGSGEDGIRNVTAIAYDLTGKSSTFGPVFFNVDNRAPTININSPKENEIISGMFFFDVDNGDVFKKGTDYNINGASWQPVSIGFNTNLVKDGPHRVTIRATDLAGHVTMETINIIVDNHDPEILIAGPNDGEYIEDSYTFKVAANDEVGVQKVIMNVAGIQRTMSYNTQTGYYEYILDTRTLLDGTYHINSTVTDLYGRKASAGDLIFNIDNNAPDLRVEAPVKDQLIKGLFVVRATAEDEFPGPVRYAIDGTTWFEISTPWNTSRVVDGRHIITISTLDQAGHRTEFEVHVTVDNTPPVISQATIAPGQILSGVQTLRFYAYDSIGIRQVVLSLNGASPFEIYRGEGGLYYEYLFDTRIVPDGNQIINLTAVDRAGNTYETSYGVKVDNTGPEISLDYYWIEGGISVSIGEVKEGNSVVFEATVIDPSGVGNVMINIDSSGWREMTPDSNASNPDTYVLFWPTSGVREGSHVFQIRTTDKIGNENTQSGLINVKEVEKKERFIDYFKDSLPVLWFILFIILVILILVLAYTGVLTKWAKGEGMQRDEDADDGKGSREGGLSSLKNRFRRNTPSEELDWDHETDER